MFKLIKLLIVLALLGALAYFAFFVKLGEMTLAEHLGVISRTEEADRLKTELRNKASQITKDVAKRMPDVGETSRTEEEVDVPKAAAPSSSDESPAPLSDISQADRAALEALIGKKNK